MEDDKKGLEFFLNKVRWNTEDSYDSVLADRYNITGIFMVLLCITLGLVFLCGYLTGVLPCEIPEILTVMIYCVSMLLFSLGIREYGRTAVIWKLKKNIPFAITDTLYKGKEFSGEHRNRAEKGSKKYVIAFGDKQHSADNVKAVKEAVDKNPKIIWMSQYLWLLIAMVCLVISYCFYLEIPSGPNAGNPLSYRMTYLIPSLIALICSVICLLTCRKRDDILYQCASALVDEQNSDISEQEAN